jgi:hypothetical protein
LPPASEIESEAPEIGQKLLRNNVTQLIDTGRTAFRFASRARVVVVAQHVNTLLETGERGLDGAARGERHSEFRCRPAHLSVRIVPELTRQVCDAREYRRNIAQFLVH